jgi:hypothetical protein
MYYDLQEIKVLDGYKIFVRFADDKEGIVDLTPIIEKGGVFEKLRDRSRFEQATIDPDWHILCWPDNIDIAPETLYESVKQMV